VRRRRERTLNSHDFIGRVNANRRAHYVREFRAYYGGHPLRAVAAYQEHEQLCTVETGTPKRLAVVRTSAHRQYTGQERLSNGRFQCGVEFYIDTDTGRIWIDSNGKRLHRGNVGDSSFWETNYRPHETLDKPRPVEAHSLCVFRKTERLNRISKLKNYEL